MGNACLIVLLVSLRFWFSFGDVGDGEYNIKIEHCIDCDGSKLKFTPRGVITLSANRANGYSATYEGEPLSAAEISLLQESSKDVNKLYRIRTSSGYDQNLDKDYVMSFTKIWWLLQSQLSDIITLSLDSSNQRVLSISIHPQRVVSNFNGEFQLSAHMFNSSVNIIDAFDGPVPETQAYFQKIEKEKQEREGGDEDNRSLIQKYWIYVVPIALFVMISGALNPEAQQR